MGYGLEYQCDVECKGAAFDPNVAFAWEINLGFDVGFRLDVGFGCDLGFHVDLGDDFRVNVGVDVDCDAGSCFGVDSYTGFEGDCADAVDVDVRFDCYFVWVLIWVLMLDLMLVLNVMLMLLGF